MKTIYLSYSDEKYEPAKKFACKMAKLIGGFDEVLHASPNDISQDFIKMNAVAFSYKRGAGLWIWKPYIIYKTLSKLNDGDILFYADSGCFVFRNICKLILYKMKTNLWCCEIPLIEEEFTKEDCFVQMNLTDSNFRKSPQRIATYFAIRKCEETIRFIKEWLKYCQNIDLLKPAESKGVLISHREDQSIFSLLTKKYGYPAHTPPEIASINKENYAFKNATLMDIPFKKEYPACIDVHKKKNITMLVVIKLLLKCIIPYSLIRHIK